MWKHFGGAFICVPQTFLLDICLHLLYSDHCTKKEVLLSRGLFGAGPDVWFCCFCLGTHCDSEQADCPDKKLTCRNLNAWETKSQIGNSHEMLPCRYQYHHFMYMCAHRPGLTTSKLCMIAWHALAWTARQGSFATIMKHSRLEIDGSSRLLQHFVCPDDHTAFW